MSSAIGIGRRPFIDFIHRIAAHCVTRKNNYQIHHAEMAPKSQVAKVSQRSDLKYKEIKRLLAKKEREKRDNAENIIEE